MYIFILVSPLNYNINIQHYCHPYPASRTPASNTHIQYECSPVNILPEYSPSPRIRARILKFSCGYSPSPRICASIQQRENEEAPYEENERSTFHELEVKLQTDGSRPGADIGGTGFGPGGGKYLELFLFD
jgi:hypothetical protein